MSCAGVAFFMLLALGSVDNDDESAKKIESEPISNISWQELDRIYDVQSGYTELQKKETWKNYKGKKVRWTGIVSSVGETFGTVQLQVKMRPDTLTSDLLIDLRDSERSKALQLREGQAVTFVGVLDDWGTIMPITLKYGQIVR
jgi:hypothetical protein